MICDKTLELLDKKAITSSAVESEVVKIGKVSAVNNATVVITGDELVGGTGFEVAVKTAETEAMSDAKVVATFETDKIDGVVLQFAIPHAVKNYMALEVKPKGSFSAGTISANVAIGPVIAA